MTSLRIVSWNIKGIAECWSELANEQGLDLALLQEAVPPADGVLLAVHPGAADWRTGGERRSFSTAVGRISDRFDVEFLPTRPLVDEGGDGLPVSQPGTIAHARVSGDGFAPITLVSVYCTWDAAPPRGGGWIIADSSAHRILSDISALIETQRGHRLIVSGDWNIYRGYGEQGSPYWRDRYQTVFDRAETLGLMFCGPEAPGGLQADPRSPYLPSDSKNVATYQRTHGDPASAQDQLDFVFASRDLAPAVSVRALDSLEEWGLSDHCRIVIDVELGPGTT